METLIESQGWFVLAIIFLISLFILSKATDTLIDHAVSLSREFGVSEIIIGATIVSLGTTLPELSTAVVAVLQGTTDFALGNAIGSFITNTTLVLGVGSLAGAIPVMRTTARRLPFLIGPLIIIIVGSLFSSSGNIQPLIGVILLLCVPIYLLTAFQNKTNGANTEKETPKRKYNAGMMFKEISIIFFSAVAVAFSATVLVTTVETVATRLGISEAIIAGTIVALGTSLPELSTTYASARKGYGGLAMGNILGANILNLLLVLGVSISLSSGGLAVPSIFYQIHFPIALLSTGLLAYFIFNTKKLEISNREGKVLLAIYIVYLLFNIFPN